MSKNNIGLLFSVILTLFFLLVLKDSIKNFGDFLIIIYALLFAFLDINSLSLKSLILLYLPAPFIILILSFYMKSSLILNIESFLIYSITALLGYEYIIAIYILDFRSGHIEKIIIKKIMAIIIFALLIKIMNELTLLLF